MWHIEEPWALPVSGDGEFETKEDAIAAITWEPRVTYCDEYREPRRIRVRWFRGQLYYCDMLVDLRYCFNEYEEARLFKEDFAIKIRELWRSSR